MGVENFSSTAAGKRSAKRARVLLAAKLETAWGETEARLRDLSQKGALVECANVPPVGSEVVFVRGNTRVPARVAWAGYGRRSPDDDSPSGGVLTCFSATSRSSSRFSRP